MQTATGLPFPLFSLSFQAIWPISNQFFVLYSSKLVLYMIEGCTKKMKKIFGFILVYMQPQSIFARHFWETLCFVYGNAGYPSYCQVQKDLQRTAPYSQCVFPR